MTKAISKAELVSRQAIRSLYEGRPLTDEERAALQELAATQEPLGKEFEEVLHDNLNDLLVRT